MTKDNAYYRSLLEQFTGNQLPLSQVDELLDWIWSSPELHEELLADPLMHEQLLNYKGPVYIPAELSASMEQRLLASIRGEDSNKIIEPVRRIPVLKMQWFRYAAILLLLAGVATYIYSVSKPHEELARQQRSGQPDIQPGGNKAKLTLADGSVIILDSAHNGLLAQQGNAAVSKLANGQIVYDVKGLSTGNAMMNTMTTPAGGQYHLRLPDGTHVWLNAVSSITYPAVFTGDKRTVRITGEAYLEVAKNKEKPFVADIAGKSTVEVLGTEFNVNSYADNGSILTTLMEGSIKVATASQSRLVKPGQQTELPVAGLTEGRMELKNNVDLDQVVAWKNGVFDFQNLDFRQVMKQLERWYGIKVKYVGQIPAIRLKGKMDRGVPLSAVLRFLTAYGINAQMENNVLTISK